MQNKKKISLTYLFPQYLGINNVLATRLEVDSDGLLTGRFLTPNCYGEEKVRRIRQAYPNLESYTLSAYGDSRGDREMLAVADHKYFKYKILM